VKATVVPAQVTTVEDRIMGSLGFSQLILLIVPIFIGGGLFVLLPPFMDGSTYKYIVIGIVTLLCIVMAIRIKEKLIAHWLVVMLRYNLRPTYYVSNKNTTAHREHYITKSSKPTHDQEKATTKTTRALPHLEINKAAQVYALINDPEANVRFEPTTKGGFNVRFTEIKD